MKTTMRRKESKPTFDPLYIIPWLQANIHLHIKAEFDKTQSTKICSVESKCQDSIYYTNTSIWSCCLPLWKDGVVERESFYGVYHSFFIYLII